MSTNFTDRLIAALQHYYPAQPDLQAQALEPMCALALRAERLFRNPEVDYAALGAKNLDQAAQTFLRAGADWIDERLTQQQTFHIIEQEPAYLTLLQNSLAKCCPAGVDQAVWARQFLVATATKFHGFNGTMTDSIQQHGVNPQHKPVPQNQLDAVAAILAKNGRSLGYQAQDRATISYALTPQFAYAYAENAPEWFSQWCGTYFFAHRDYDAARDMVAAAVTHPDITPTEQQTVRDFFDRCWQKFTPTTTNGIAMTPYFTDAAAQQYLAKPGTLRQTVNDLMVAPDLRTTTAFDPAHTTIITLPNRAHFLTLLATQQQAVTPRDSSGLQTADYGL